jgi:hypothetical protein
VLPLLSADHVFQASEHIIVAGERKTMLNMMDK